MKTTYAYTALFALAMTYGATAAEAKNNSQWQKLKDRIEVVNIEDQRLTDGSLSGDVLTLYTEDMDGHSRRPVTIDLSDLAGQDGRDADYGDILSAQSSIAALGAVELPQPLAGGWSYGAAVTGLFADYGNDAGAAGALGYGINADAYVWGKVAKGAVALGIAGRF